MTFFDFTASGRLKQEVSDCPSKGSNYAYYMDLCPANVSPSRISGLNFRINESKVVRINAPVQTCFLDLITTRFAILRTMDPQDWWVNNNDSLTCSMDFFSIQVVPSFFQFWNSLAGVSLTF